MRSLKWLAGLLLLPACVGVTRSLAGLAVSLAAQPDAASARSLAALLVGLGLWVALYFCLPRPTLSYIFAHELTHALWALLLGVRVTSIRVGAASGRVGVSRSHFLVTLAPYFFPLYALLVVALYNALARVGNVRDYEPFWLGLIGLAWGFHLTFTVQMLLTHQSDIAREGRLFSYTVIYLFNVLGIALGIVALTPPTLRHFARRAAADTAAAYAAVPARSRALLDRSRALIAPADPAAPRDTP